LPWLGSPSFTTQLVRDTMPDDETFGAMAARFSPREIIHLLLAIEQYMMLGRITATTRIDLDPALERRPCQRRAR
jgi:hypothetical protein